MLFQSLNNPANCVGLRDAVLNPISTDGGQYMPQRLPLLPRAFFNNLSEMTIREASYIIAMMMVGDEIPPDQLKHIVEDSFNFDIPLKHVHDGIYVLELFHGPTGSFKDIGARFLANILSHFASKKGTIHVLAATSGDSGGAIAAGFADLPGVKTHVLYPSGVLTEQQVSDICRARGTVEAIEVKGTFDDCHALVQAAVSDPELKKKMAVTTANTINIMRLIPQMFYYFYGVGQLLAKQPRDSESPIISVPCGNLGNLTAGVSAYLMGLPVKRFVAACNANDVFSRFIHTGTLSPQTPQRTIAPAMDVGHLSNLKRLEALMDNELDKLQALIEVHNFADSEIASHMIDTYCVHSYLMDPHSATAYAALLNSLRPGETGMFLATAHPSKYAQTVQEITGAHALDLCMVHDRSHHEHVTLPNRYNALKRHLFAR